MANSTCPINPNCAARLARLDERSEASAETIKRIEEKVDALSERVWGLKLKVAVIAVGSSGVVAGILKLLSS